MRTSGIILLFISQVVFCINPPITNSKNAALGGASAAYQNNYGIFGNVATMRFNKSNLAITGLNSYGLNEYSTATGVFGYSMSSTEIGFGYAITPQAGFVAQNFKLGVSNQILDNLWLGVVLNYDAFKSSNAFYENNWAITGNLGVFYKPTEALGVGLTVNNLGNGHVSNIYQEKLLPDARLGLSYAIDERIAIYTDGVIVPGNPILWQTGLEANLPSGFVFRGGFSLSTPQATVGIGYHKNKLQFDFAASYHNQLGVSPVLTLGYGFN